MELNTVKKLTNELERELTTLVKEYEEQTGMTVYDIVMNYAPQSRFDRDAKIVIRKKFITPKVTLGKI